MMSCVTDNSASSVSKGPQSACATKDALSNDVVLSLIFGYLCAEDLKSVRRVCKKWNSIGAMHLKKSNKYITLESRPKTREFMALMSTSPAIPFDCFSFRNSHVELYDDVYLELFSKINIRRLRIHPGINFSVLREMLVFHVYSFEALGLSLERFSHLEPVKFFLEDHKKIRNPLLPKLKNLCVTISEASYEFLQDLFQAAPCLEHLAILQRRSDYSVEDSIRALNGFVGRRFKSIILLQANYKCLRDDMDALTDFFKANEAQEILIRFQPVGMNFQTILKFFTAISDYVEYFDYALNFDLTNFPVMKKLKNLETNQWSVLANLTQTFPSLETLRLGSVDETVSHSVLAPEQVPTFTNLTHLHILEYEGFKLITDECLLSRTFSGLPNIRKLCLHCVDKTLPIICEHLRNLEELRLGSESLITDEGITGIPIHYCKDISHLNFPTTVVGDPKRLRYKGLPWFDKCKNLRLFHIDPPPRKHGKATTRRNVTNNSVFFGFAFMKSLRNLSIPFTQLDDDALACIGKHRHLRLVQLNLSGCPHLSKKGVETLKSRRRRLQVINNLADDEFYDSCDPRYAESLLFLKTVDPVRRSEPEGGGASPSLSEDSDTD